MAALSGSFRILITGFKEPFAQPLYQFKEIVSTAPINLDRRFWTFGTLILLQSD